MSKNPLAWKFLLILAVIVVMGFAAFPPDERINLGLDLQGGLHIVMQVDTDSALKYDMDLRQTRMGNSLKDDGITYESVFAPDNTTLEIRGTDPAQDDQLSKKLNALMGAWSPRRVQAGLWRMKMPSQERVLIETGAVDTTLTTLRNRIDALGVAEPTVQKQGLDGDRILIQLPGVENPERVKGILKEPALLEWKAVSYPPAATPGSWAPPETQQALLAQFGGQLPDDTQPFLQEFVRDDGTTAEVWWPLKRVSVVAGNDLKDANADRDEWGDSIVSFELTQDAGRRFEVATRENLGRQMAIVLGGVRNKKVISAPVIEGVIRDRGLIRGSFTQSEVQDLAIKLRSGAIPTDVQIIEERTVGPSLGRDSIRAGLISGIASFIGVMLFMLFYYRFAGVNAVVALALNVLLVFGALGALPFLFAGAQATLTLPGIAGLVLTVGMAVDSNVLIFERIREELKVGKTIRAAVEQGFGKAFITILDCNVTTLVAAFFLFSQGTGPVKGFAVTLIIGLLASMFTAVFVSRQLFELLLRRKTNADTLSI